MDRLLNPEFDDKAVNSNSACAKKHNIWGYCSNNRKSGVLFLMVSMPLNGSLEKMDFDIANASGLGFKISRLKKANTNSVSLIIVNLAKIIKDLEKKTGNRI